MKTLAFILISLMTMKLWAQELPPQGTFVRPCYAVSDDILNSEIQISGSAWSTKFTAFEESGCKTAYLVFETLYSIQHQEPHPSGFHKLDLSVQEVSYTPLSDEVAEALNFMTYCGFDNWKKDEKKIVTGLICDEFEAPAKGTILYTIFQISKEASLMLGTESKGAEGFSENTRHQHLDKKEYLLR